MTKRFFIATLCLFALLSVEAQTIKEGDEFYDGCELYKVQEIRMGKIVYMTTPHDDELTLEKVDGKEGMYTLCPSRQAEEAPYGAKFGWQVQYLCQEGVNGLIIRRPNGDALEVLPLATEGADGFFMNEEIMRNEEPGVVLTTILVNRNYLMNVSNKEKLRLMRNEIMARHGYRFKSKDLKQWFEKKSWYTPCKDNNAIKLSLIEQLNIQLIKSEEARRNNPEG